MHDRLGFTALYAMPIAISVAKILGTTLSASAALILLVGIIRSFILGEPLRSNFQKIAQYGRGRGPGWAPLSSGLLVLSIVPSLVLGLLYVKIWGLQPIGASLADFRLEIHQQYWVGSDLTKRLPKLNFLRHHAKPVITTP